MKCMMETFKGHWAGHCWVSWGEGIKTPYSTGSSWRPLSIAYFLSLLFLLLLVSPHIDPVLLVLNLHMKYTVEVVPLCTYIVWFVRKAFFSDTALSYDSNPICMKCCCVFAHCYSWWGLWTPNRWWALFTSCISLSHTPPTSRMTQTNICLKY